DLSKNSSNGITCAACCRFLKERKMRVLTLLIAVMLTTTAVGCNRQDTECLSRIGKKVAVHAKRNAGDVGAKFDIGWLGKRESTLQEKVQDRLRFENTLTDVTFEVTVKDKEVDLKGTVKNAQQRQRAIELAETLAGVDRVTDAITVKDDDGMAQ